MSWQDRDYARRPGMSVGMGGVGVGGGRPGLSWGGKSVVTKLMIVNVAIFVLCSLTSGRGGSMMSSGLFRFGVMELGSVLHGQIWRLVTSDYLHWDVMHLFMNMLGLHFFGRTVERVYGGRAFFLMYTVAGLLGSVFYAVLAWTGILAPGVAAGASGCVFGVMGACAVLFPRTQVWVMMMFPVRIRTLVVVLGAMFALNVLKDGENAGGDACHIAGLIVGFAWARYWSSMRGHGVVHRGWVSDAAAKLRSTVVSQVDSPVDSAAIDRILQKVHDRGVGSLSEREKETLASASRQRRSPTR